ncbi:hypothetical protein B0T17DRAFT_509881 [Bombardia bombarda]|uniref:Uncharacterized protein n=1 Tax=Bombardia bombarda TaxID=252184 RepID=A0AA40BYG5_9PEZI|nr:hypothetical protein B0T17DRAFT_509881 [Bombardia bombarda]
MLSSTMILQFILALAAVCLAAPQYLHLAPRVIVPQSHYEVLRMRASTTVDPSAVTGVNNIVFHDLNVAELGICGGIAGKITKCGGAPATTTGQSGTALFKLNAVNSGATINISKGRWEQCIRAARAVCPTGSMSGTCIGGASAGNVAFTLGNP